MAFGGSFLWLSASARADPGLGGELTESARGLRTRRPRSDTEGPPLLDLDWKPARSRQDQRGQTPDARAEAHRPLCGSHAREEGATPERTPPPMDRGEDPGG